MLWGLTKLVGLGWTLLILAAVWVCGLVWASWEMRRISRRRVSTAGELANKSADWGLVAAGSMLVALPGLVTTVLGFIVMYPPSRWVIKKIAQRKMLQQVAAFGERSFTITEQVATSRTTRGPRFGTPVVVDEDEIDKFAANATVEDFIDPKEK